MKRNHIVSRISALALAGMMCVGYAALPEEIAPAAVVEAAVSYPDIESYGYEYYMSSINDNIEYKMYSNDSSDSKKNFNSYLSAWKKKGYTITKDEEEGVTAYKIKGNKVIVAVVGAYDEDASIVAVAFSGNNVIVDDSTSGSSSSKKLSAPGGISYSSTSNSITLKWNKVSGADAYRIYVSSDEFDADDLSKLINIEDSFYFSYKSVAGTQYTIDGLSKNTTYHFVIAPLDKTGNNKYTEGKRTGVIKAKTKAASLPSAPSANYTGKATSGGKTYYFKNGKISKGFVKTASGYMYFDPTTYEMKTGWVTANGASYYFGSDGIMFANGTYKIDGKTYVISADGKAKAKSTTSTSTTKTTTGKKKSYPNLFDYGFTEGSTYGYDFDVVGNTYSDNSVDMYGKYIKAWMSNGYYVKHYDTESNYPYVNDAYVVFSDKDHTNVIAIVGLTVNCEVGLSTVAVTYY
ncbi:MAG: hypothetical protein IKP75_05125 [Oscillospiraceae bacterium]|nr:hypothetical protein [Oscillospiraceae bacterium]